MIKRIKNSLTINICILIAVLLTASSGITYAVIVGFLPTYYSKQLQKDIDSVSQEMIETIHSYETINEASYAIELFEAGSKVSVVILDEQGNRIWPAESTAATEDVLDNGVVEQGYMGDMILTRENSAEQTTIVQEENAAYEEGVIGQADVVTEDVVQQADGIAEAGDNSAVKRYSVTVGGETYTMIVSGGMQPVNQALEILYQILPYILGIAIVVSILFALGASLYLTFPIVRLSQLAQNMAALDFDSSYQGKRTDEVGVLGESLNELSKNLSRALEELKSANEKLKSDIEMERKIEKKRIAFFSAVSHELKTPLSGLRILLENMQYNIGKYKDRDKYLAEAVAKVDELSGMVRDILDTSKVQDLQEEEKQKLYAGGEIGAVLQEYAMQIADKKLEVTDSIPEDCMLFMSRNTFQKVWSNLIGNAVQYTEQGGQITIAADTDKIWIENSCTPLTEEQLAYIYEPFYRVDDTRAASGGNGLGLYVVRELLKKEGFRYVFEPVEDGMRFTIFL